MTAEIQGPVTTQAFSEVFHSLLSFDLADSRGDPVGDFTDLHVWKDHFVVVDAVQSNVKVFNRDGSRRMTLGRPGDGPGEFRSPRAVAATSDGGLAILDRRMRLSLFDPSGAYLETRTLPGVNPQDLHLLPASTNRYVLSASVGDGTTGYGALVLHLNDPTGTHVHRVRRSPRLYEGNFQSVRAVWTGSSLASIDQTTNRLVVSNLKGEALRHIRVATDVYEPPAWPTEEIADLSDLTAWANRQTWTRVLVPLSKREVLVGLSHRDEELERRVVRYVVVNVVTGAQVIVRDPQRVQFRAVSGDTLYSGRTLDDGSARIRSFVRAGP